MKTRSLGFIGGGRITRIFLQAFRNAGASFGSIVVYDNHPGTAAELKKRFPGIRIADTPEKASKQDAVFIALHPPAIMESLDVISNFLKKDVIIVSLAPKISIEKINSVLGSPNIVRVIPNATSWMNKGYNPVCFSGEFDPRLKEQLMRLLELLGNTFEVPEPKLESYAIVSAMLPTYFWFQWDKMIDIGVQTGLEWDESAKAVHETLKAALDLMFDSGLSYAQVTDLIPVKPIGDHEEEINRILQTNLLGLHKKISP